jgi:phosphatidylglycerol:prolipoprotein diacylglycerol transferase
MEALAAWWQHLPSRIDPYLLELGSFRVGWYGMMYVIGFLVAYGLSVYRAKRDGFHYTADFLQDFMVWVAFGLLIGARLGYVLIYNPVYYLSHPLDIFLPFEFEGGISYKGISGMSFHGGAVGVFLAGAWFVRKKGESIVEFSDFFVPCIPIAYFFGRLGNFINGELFGRATDVPWGMYFPTDPANLLRHPSQLYEAFFEGIVLFAVLWPIRNSKRLRGLMIPIYLAGYAFSRFFIEYFREPDEHLGFVLGPLSMGQLLSLAMLAIAVAAALIFRRTGVGTRGT